MKYDSGSVPEQSIFSPRGTSPTCDSGIDDGFGKDSMHSSILEKGFFFLGGGDANVPDPSSKPRGNSALNTPMVRRWVVANFRALPQKWPAPPWKVAGSFRWTQRLNLLLVTAHIPASVDQNPLNAHSQPRDPELINPNIHGPQLYLTERIHQLVL